MEWRIDIIYCLNCYVKQINTKKYKDYIITDRFFGDNHTGDMRVKRERKF